MSDNQTKDGVWTTANKITMARILLIPVFVVVLVAPWPKYFPAWMDMSTAKPWIAALVFVLLSATDSLDGYLARSRGEVTDFGKFMDPLADKLLVAAALLGLVEQNVLPSWVALIIIVREFIVSGLRMVAANQGEVIAASWYGKAKTVFQMVAIVMFIVKDSHVITNFNMLMHDWLYILSWIVMIIAVILTILSMFDYLYKARFLLGFTSKNRKRFWRRRKATKPEEEEELQSEFESFLTMDEAAEHVVQIALQSGKTIATAESCTGGLISAAITSVPGSSGALLGSIVSYSNEVKVAKLGVSEATLREHGAVSEETACEMAQGAVNALGVDRAVSVTGIAGPDGGTPDKPVGTVWIGCSDGENTFAEEHHFEGTRMQVRESTVIRALEILGASLLASEEDQ